MPQHRGSISSETLTSPTRVHVIGAGPVGLLLTALLQPSGRFSIDLYEKRADYTRTAASEPERLVWRQELEATPFERILAEATTSVELAAAEGGTRVTLALDQKPRGWARLAPFQFRAAGKRQVEGALEGLERLLA